MEGRAGGVKVIVDVDVYKSSFVLSGILYDYEIICTIMGMSDCFTENLP